MADAALWRLIPGGTSPLLCAMLDGIDGALLPPIRAELFGLERFAQHGRSLGATHRVPPPVTHPLAPWRAVPAVFAALFAPTFVPRLRSNVRVLRQAHDFIGTQAASGHDVSPAAEWLLDNFHLVEAQLKAVHDGLPRRYFRSLPVLVDEPLAGLPRIYSVAWAYVAHTDGAFNEDLLVHFLNAYQEARPLSLRELWALPTTLRVVLIENLRRLAERVATHKAAREVANACCDQIDPDPGHDGSARLDRLLARLNRRGAGPAFLAQMAQRLHDIGSSGSLHPASRHRAWLQRVLPQPALLLDQQRADETADNLSVSNAVRSLRSVADADWADMIGRTSALMQAMFASPVFVAEDSASRDETLHGIERLARRSGREEAGVAHTLLGLMAPADLGRASGDRRALAGHWLQGTGRPTLLRALGLPQRLAGWTRWLAPRLALPAYLAAVALGSAGLVAWWLPAVPAVPTLPAALTTGWTAATAWLALFALLMAFPVSEAVIAVIHRLISESTRPHRLPRYAYAGGLPASQQVLVVVPTMLGDAHGLELQLHTLRRHHLANPERHAQFALLTDWADAPSASAPADDAQLAAARAGIEALNRLHPVGEVPAVGAVDPASAPLPRFLLLHRHRAWSESEQAWIGWERKRGKLEQLVHALASGDRSAFVDLGALSCPQPGTRLLLTLDSDTQLPPGRLRELVGVAAHPANAPQLDASGRRVIGGYGILQPRVATPLPSADAITPFHTLFAGQCGLDPYSAASSEVYQDVHGEGTFSGKGLLHVGTVHAVLAGRLPQAQVLSHDLLEGALVRCALVSDIALIEEAPFHADLAAARLHRWTRGDWQLLPILLRPWRYPMKAVNRWKMVDNLRRSLVAPMTWALVMLSVAMALLAPDMAARLAPAHALLIALAAFVAGPLMGALAAAVPIDRSHAWRHHLRHVGEDLARVTGGGLWHLAMLQQHALDSLDAVGRALHRQFVSRRHLLQWMPSAQAGSRASLDLRVLLAEHAPASALALVQLGALALALAAPAWLVLLPTTVDGLAEPTRASAWALGWSLLWLGTPLWTRWVSRPRPRRPAAGLSPTGRHYLQGVARDSWRLFERCVGPADHHLPPDNLQTDPQDVVARRTSPTNIGLYLLSAACARAFGWIDSAELASRLEATLDTLDRLARHRGHFLNWYDTAQATPLLPMYVSAVDSGNLCGHLVAVAQACLDDLPEPWPATQRAALAARLATLARRCQRLAWEADFSFLHHRKRRLLHIGYRVAEQQLDAGFYDLLASESRLTSLWAIAKGDVPVAHWAALGRPFYALGSRVALRSWSGSMFEYLMPTLVLAEPHGSVLREACGSAIREQVDHGRALGLPWGVSECAHAGRDHNLTYQYAPQGVPRLALRRTPPDEHVVAPYASALAAQLVPHLACLNLMALEDLSARGACGFVDALDYTPARLTVLEGGATRGTPVSTFMAHHQGMTIVALANVLLGGLAQRWGMADPHLDAMASLLHEQPPREVSTLSAPAALPATSAADTRLPVLFREVLPGASAIEPTHAFGNGRLGVTLRANGCGTSRWGEIGIHRERDDALRDAHGNFLYLRRGGATPVSLSAHPAPDPLAIYRSVFHADRVTFETEWADLLAQTTVWVSPEDDVEFRQVEWRNLGDLAVEIEVLSAFDISLADPRADEAHPAFGNLFVSARWLPAQRALLFERKARLAQESPVHLAHFLAACDPAPLDLSIQTSRLAWLGRPGRPDRPQGLLQRAEPQPCDLLTGLDPVSVLATTLRIPARGKARVTFATAIAAQPGTVLAMVDKYRQREHVRRASLMSSTLAGIRLRSLAIGAESTAAVQALTTALVMTLSRVERGESADPPAGAPDRPLVAGCDRRRLWRLGISGDRPWILVSVGVLAGLGLVRSLVQALRGWSWAGVACDLIVVDTELASYHMTLHHELKALAERHGADTATPGLLGRTAVHLVHAGDLDAQDRQTLRRHARANFVSDGRPLLHHVQEWLSHHEADRARRRRVAVRTVGLTPARPDGDEPPAPARTGAAIVATPIGRFVPETGEFGFDIGPHMRPQRPWINVLANPGFGCLISESGAGSTWAVNSRLHQLTAWSNDAVADPPGEWFLLQLREGRRSWSITPSAWGEPETRYRITHAQGSTRIEHRIDLRSGQQHMAGGHGGTAAEELRIRAVWSVDADLALKQVRITLSRHGAPADARPLALRLVGLVEWMLGARRADRASVACRAVIGPQQTVLLATQTEQADGFGGATAFLTLQADFQGIGPDTVDRPGRATSPARPDWTCDRREFLDDDGRLVLPDALGRHGGPGPDPAAALAVDIDLGPDQAVERVFLIGHGDTPEAALQLARSALQVDAAVREDAALTRWDTLLGAVSVRTPDALFDALVNRWLLYQTVACRLWAKAAHAQAGGATGFRDQLQDALALAWSAPELLRAQIVLCASRQYAAGDVQHWWHAPAGAGVRTHFSDDLLWLPHACAHHLARCGEDGLLDTVVPFLSGGQIPAGAEDLYETPQSGPDAASVYEHAARAIDRSLLTGAHGLPLMGSGDWNDGMNRVGHEGRGESVWLAWFLCTLVRDFTPIARARGDLVRVQRWQDALAGWTTALAGPAWDGQWYRRAFFDDGSALGGAANAEARIDLIAQAWSVFADVSPAERQQTAMASMERHLEDPAHGLLRLLDPPFAQSEPSPGYIQAYPPGIRENGGQYAHAAVWGLMAQATLARRLRASDPVAAQRQADAAWRTFTHLSPAHRSADAQLGPLYLAEPYAMAGDIYSQPPYAGRAGWTWYTGSASWLHRAAIESIFGLTLTATTFSLTPGLPSHWPRAELTLRRGGLTLNLNIRRAPPTTADAAEDSPRSRRLAPGQTVDWRGLEGTCDFLLVLEA